MTYLVLYHIDWKSWQSVLIALATRSIYTHSAIQVGDKVFEASGHRKVIGWIDADFYADRESKRIELDIPRERAIEILSRYEGKLYDYTALRWWAFSLQRNNRFYCFELCWEFLKTAGLTKSEPDRKITAHILLDIGE